MKRNLFFLLLIIFISSSALAQREGIVVKQINQESFEKLIKERNGKVLLLNLWATWCVPCREEFPDLVKLHNTYSEKNLEIVGISIDYPEEVKSKIIPFLKKQKAKFTNYVNGFNKDEELINIINPKWNGALPATAIYDKSGNQIAFIEGKKSYAEFIQFLKPVISE